MPEEPMISAITGEVSFEDGLVIQAFCSVRALLENIEEVKHATAAGWTSFSLGNHRPAMGHLKPR